MRVSIKKHNRFYLEQLSAQMECDCGEALNYLLVELRRINFSFNSQINLGINASPLPVIEKPIEPGQMAMSALSYIADTDPVIERLVSVGLEDF